MKLITFNFAYILGLLAAGEIVWQSAVIAALVTGIFGLLIELLRVHLKQRKEKRESSKLL